MMKKQYPLFKVHVGEDAIHNINIVLNSGFINEGVEVTRLTEALSDKLKSKNLVLMNSCTSAITVALKLAGVGPGSVVVSTPMTCVATNTPIASLNARVKWADVDPDTGMVSAKTLKRALSNDKIAAVVVVAWAGTPPNMRKLQEVCSRRKIPLILDAAHAFGATFSGVPVHHWADFTCYSFQAIKHFTTGDGGALVCTSDKDAARAKRLKWFGLDRDSAKDEKGNWKGQQWDVDVQECGYKFNMNNVAAAIGLSQMPHIDSIIEKHRSNAALYDKLFQNHAIIKPTKKHEHSQSSNWVYTLLLPDSMACRRDAILKKLNEDGVMAGVVHVPNHTYSAFKDNLLCNLPGTASFSSRQISLPCGWWLETEDIVHIANAVIVAVQ